MADNKNIGCVIPLIVGVVCAVIAGGNKDNTNAVTGFFLGAGICAIIIWRINNGPKYW